MRLDIPRRLVAAHVGAGRRPGADARAGSPHGLVLAWDEEFDEALHTQRADAGAIATFDVSDSRVVSARWSANVTEHDRVYGATRVLDRNSSVFGEATMRGQAGIHRWLVGAALQYEELHVRDVPGVGYA